MLSAGYHHATLLSCVSSSLALELANGAASCSPRHFHLCQNPTHTLPTCHLSIYLPTYLHILCIYIHLYVDINIMCTYVLYVYVYVYIRIHIHTVTYT